MENSLKTATVSLVYGRIKGRNAVEIRIYFKKEQKQIYVSTGVTVQPSYWNKKRHIINPSKDFVSKQKKIDDIFFQVEYIIQKDEYENEWATKERFLKAFKGKDTKTKKRSPLVYLYCASAIERSNISDSSKKAQRHTGALLKEFSPRYTLDDISLALVEEWDKFLHTKYDNLNTIAGHHKNLKKYLNMAYNDGVLSEEKFRNFKKFKAPKIKGSRGALMPEQVMAIESLEYPEFSLLDNVRNMFLFSCYTGLRISDVTGLEPQHIISENSRGVLLKKPVYKLRHLDRMITLPIEKLFGGKPYGLVKKYMENTPESKTVFPPYAHPVINRYLKIVAHDAEIDTPISFHYSRHTFMTILALKTGNLFTVMEYGGVTSVTTAQGYIHMASKWIDKGLQTVDWSLTA